MRKILAAIAMCGLFVPSALAASESVEAAIKTFNDVGNDPERLKTYCEMGKLMSSAGEVEDESKAAEIDKQMEDYIKKLGSDFESAFEAGADLDPDSDDGKAYDAALDELDTKCG